MEATMADDKDPGATTEMVGNDAGTELASNRTSLAFERTRMAGDRTLMAIVRTALSLISFGFTIHQVFQQLKENPAIQATGTHAARHFGASLVFLGVGLLALGIASQWHFTRELTRRRERLYGLRLLHRTMQYTTTPTFLVACVLLLLGCGAILTIVWRIGPF
jgi:putative membrane protein